MVSTYSSASAKSWKDLAVEKLGPIETFFDTKFTRFIKNFRLVIVLISIGAASYAGVRSAEI